MAVQGRMLGRDHERATLVAALGRGGSAVVVGAVGVGKTHLATVVSADLARHGHRVSQVLATASVRDIPLGALAPLLPSVPQVRDGAALARAREAILRAAPAGLTLVVDDAHLLDGVSATLIHQLVGTGRVGAMLVTQCVDALPGAAAALAGGAGTVQVAVGPLSEDASAGLAEAQLGGQVDSATAARLHQLSRGIPLVLRELIRLGRASGAITSRRGVWGLTGSMPADTGLAHLVSLRLDRLSPAQRDAAEAIAMAEPVELAVLERLAGHVVAEELETLGLLATSGEDGSEIAGMAHPLYSELLRAAVPGTRRRRLANALVAAYEAAGQGDPVQLALLRVTAGLPTDPGALTSTAMIAARHDHRLAERLLRAAVRAGGRITTRLALARLLALTDTEEALDLLADVREPDVGAADWVAVRLLRALALTVGSGRPDMVLAELGDVTGQPAPIRLAAALAHLFAGHVIETVAIARSVLSGPRLPPPLERRAILCLVAALATAGQLDEAIRTGYDALAGDQGAADADPDFWGISAALLLALERRGAVDEALGRGRALLARAASLADGPARARMLQCVGRAELLRGRPGAAARAFREAIALLRGADDTFLPWNLGLLAAAEAAAGHLQEAIAHLAEMDSAPRDLPVYHPEQELARAWVSAAAGELTAARAAAGRAARLAEQLGHAPVALLAWNTIARYGSPVSALPGARAAAARVDGPLGRLLGEQVEALAARDPARLACAGEGLAGLGVVGLAAEALAAAAAGLRRSGDHQQAASVAQRLHATLNRCEPSALTASALLSAATEPLTPREREVAVLAARGMADRVIAARLGISPRTVQTHLARAYAKTGLTSREQLPGLLGLTP